MASSAFGAASASAVGAAADTPRHTAVVRVTHWITAVAFLALLVTGLEIVVSHPRFYWGETGNVHMRPLFAIPIPSSRATVPTGYGYVLPDQNGWSRSLHFEAGWVLVLTGLLYAGYGVATGHFRKNLWPRRTDASGRSISTVIGDHLRFRRPHAAEAWSYNSLQRLAYLAILFLAFPMIIWTGLAMSPAVVSAFPFLVSAVGGQQSARTIHFFLTIGLVLFVLVHIAMVWLAGFTVRVRAMLTGRVDR